MNTSADLILFNGKITTLDRQKPQAQAAAIRDGRFIAVGGMGGRVGVRGVSTRGTTITFSHRLAGALRPVPVEPSEEKCHNDRDCGRTHPCRSEA
jgi:hypothetical protein